MACYICKGGWAEGSVKSLSAKIQSIFLLLKSFFQKLLLYFVLQKRADLHLLPRWNIKAVQIFVSLGIIVQFYTNILGLCHEF